MPYSKKDPFLWTWEEVVAFFFHDSIIDDQQFLVPLTAIRGIDSIEASFVREQVNGACLLEELNHETLRDEFGINARGVRANVLRIATCLRRKSKIYRDEHSDTVPDSTTHGSILSNGPYLDNVVPWLARDARQTSLASVGGLNGQQDLLPELRTGLRNGVDGTLRPEKILPRSSSLRTKSGHHVPPRGGNSSPLPLSTSPTTEGPDRDTSAISSGAESNFSAKFSHLGRQQRRRVVPLAVEPDEARRIKSGSGLGVDKSMPTLSSSSKLSMGSGVADDRKGKYLGPQPLTCKGLLLEDHSILANLIVKGRYLPRRKGNRIALETFYLEKAFKFVSKGLLSNGQRASAHRHLRRLLLLSADHKTIDVSVSRQCALSALRKREIKGLASRRRGGDHKTQRLQSSKSPAPFSKDLDLLLHGALEDDDEVLPLYGESDDDNAYDSETWEEMLEEKEERANDSHRSSGLSYDQVRLVVADELAAMTERWQARVLPKEQRKAYQIWRQARRHGMKGEVMRHKTELRTRLAPRLKDMMEAIYNSKPKDEASVRFQCKSLQETVYQGILLNWQLMIIAKDNPPDNPARVDTSIAPLRERAKRVKKSLENGETIEDLGSSSSDDDAFIDDTHEELVTTHRSGKLETEFGVNPPARPVQSTSQTHQAAQLSQGGSTDGSNPCAEEGMDEMSGILNQTPALDSVTPSPQASNDISGHQDQSLQFRSSATPSTPSHKHRQRISSSPSCDRLPSSVQEPFEEDPTICDSHVLPIIRDPARAPIDQAFDPSYLGTMVAGETPMKGTQHQPMSVASSPIVLSSRMQSPRDDGRLSGLRSRDWPSSPLAEEGWNLDNSNSEDDDTDPFVVTSDSDGGQNDDELGPQAVPSYEHPPKTRKGPRGSKAKMLVLSDDEEVSDIPAPVLDLTAPVSQDDRYMRLKDYAENNDRTKLAVEELVKARTEKNLYNCLCVFLQNKAQIYYSSRARKEHKPIPSDQMQDFVRCFKVWQLNLPPGKALDKADAKELLRHTDNSFKPFFLDLRQILDISTTKHLSKSSKNLQRQRESAHVRQIQAIRSQHAILAQDGVAMLRAGDEKRQLKNLSQSQDLAGVMPDLEDDSSEPLEQVRINTSDPPLYLHRRITRGIMEHQIDGIRFIFRELITGVAKIHGCLLAHTMGLGKTMQVIGCLITITSALMHEVNHPALPPEWTQFEYWQDRGVMRRRNLRILILVPPVLVGNWVSEFQKWLGGALLANLGRLRQIGPQDTGRGRLRIIADWHREGGALIMSMHVFRTAMIPNVKKDTAGATATRMDEDAAATEARKRLSKGAEIVVLDEAHAIKSVKSKISQAVDMIKTTRRIAMTGSPMANHLDEYFRLLDWVAPNYLDRRFREESKHVIELGMRQESDALDKKRALKFLKLLELETAPKVHRASYKDLQTSNRRLPPKKEFVIIVPLTDLQRDSYVKFIQGIKHELEEKGETDQRRPNASQLWKYMVNLVLVCDHPWTYVQHRNKVDHQSTLKRTVSKSRMASNLDNAIAEDDEANGNEQAIEEALAVKLPPQIVSDQAALFSAVRDLGSPHWSHKMAVVLAIVQAAKAAKDKILIFSQNLKPLEYLSLQLKALDIHSFLMQGNIPMAHRAVEIENFNNPKHPSSVYLISTTSGGVGLNLQGANRVIILDAKWNPMDEEQAIGRSYRMGQRKDVFVYRMIAGGTIETRLMSQGIFKLNMASTVVDKQKTDRSSKRKYKYLFEPEEVPQEDLHEPAAADPLVLGKMVQDSQIAASIRQIRPAASYRKPDEEILTAEEQQEVEKARTQISDARRNPNPNTKGVGGLFAPAPQAFPAVATGTHNVTQGQSGSKSKSDISTRMVQHMSNSAGVAEARGAQSVNSASSSVPLRAGVLPLWQIQHDADRRQSLGGTHQFQSLNAWPQGASFSPHNPPLPNLGSAPHARWPPANPMQARQPSDFAPDRVLQPDRRLSAPPGEQYSSGLVQSGASDRLPQFPASSNQMQAPHIPVPSDSSSTPRPLQEHGRMSSVPTETSSTGTSAQNSTAGEVGSRYRASVSAVHAPSGQAATPLILQSSPGAQHAAETNDHDLPDTINKTDEAIAVEGAQDTGVPSLHFEHVGGQPGTKRPRASSDGANERDAKTPRLENFDQSQYVNPADISRN